MDNDQGDNVIVYLGYMYNIKQGKARKGVWFEGSYLKYFYLFL